MVLKIMSFIFVISLASGFQNQIKDVPINVNEVINQVSPSYSQSPNSQYQNPPLPTDAFLVDTSIYLIGAQNSQETPSIAFDGTNYFVVWEDRRSGSSYIYGARVSQTGIILDPDGFQISNAEYGQSWPSIIYDGIQYFVVWEDYRNGSYDIYGARVNREGLLLDSAGIPISTSVNNQRLPRIAFDGTNYLVVWQDNRIGGQTDIYCARVTQAGVVLDLNGIVIAQHNYNQDFPAVAFDGENYLVVWDDNRGFETWDLYGARVTRFGNVLDPSGFTISTAQSWQTYPSIAFDGTNYLVVWQDFRSMSSYQIYGARVTPARVVLDRSGIPISTGTWSQERPSIIFDSINYLVVWQDNRNGSFDIYGSRINQAGIVLDSAGIPVSINSNDQQYPSIAIDNTNYFMVWQSYTSGSNDIYGARMNQDGIVLDSTSFLISTKANEQQSPSIAFDSTNYLVVWQDRHITSCDIYGIRINQAGIAEDSASISISSAIKDQYSPSVAFDGTNYLAVWEDERSGSSDIYGARINQDGVVLDLPGIPISTAVNDQNSPAIAFDGINYIVVWSDERMGSSYIYGARVNQAGVILEPDGFQISNAAIGQYFPSVAFDGTNYLVVWEDRRSGSYDIYGTRINQAGIIQDSSGISISIANSSQRYPSITFAGSYYFVVWQDNRSGSYDIYGARLNQAGIVLDPSGIPISTVAYNQISPSVNFDGSNYLVVWEDWRNRSLDIFGACVNTSGIVIDTFPVLIDSGYQYSPTLAKGLGNQVLLTYSGWTGEYQDKTYNTYRIWGNFYPFIGIQEENLKIKMQNAKVLEVYPNPFKSKTTIHFSISANCKALLKIYDVSGKLVKSFSIYHQQLIPRNCLVWTGTNDSGNKVPAGVYICRLKTTEGTTETKEIIIMK